MAEFTNGPWRIELEQRQLTDRAVLIALIRSSAEPVLSVTVISRHTEADARLVMASPEMYAVLKQMEGEARHVLESNGEMPQSVMNRARAIVNAVERAEGKQ